MKKFATLVAAIAATLTLSAGLYAATPTPTHHTVQARVARHTAKPLTATATKVNTAQAPSCCADGNCCAAGACCAMPGCCQSGGACCSPDQGIRTSACGCLTMTCCH